MAEDDGGYSLVMTGFSGKWGDLWDKSFDVFGRPGFPAMALAHGLYGRTYLPAELLAGLPKGYADTLAARLSELGVAVDVLPSNEVSNVACRPPDIWPDRVVGRYCFTEIDRMIFWGVPLAIRANLQIARYGEAPGCEWKHEWGENHVHADMSLPDREHVRQEKQMVAKLSAALREAYPDRRFIVTHAFCNAVSFYQATDDGPGPGVTYDKEARYHGLCVTCQKATDWIPLPAPDPEFPEAEWARCEVCGNDIIAREPDVRVLVGPDTGAQPPQDS